VRNSWTPCLEFADPDHAYVGNSNCIRMVSPTILHRPLMCAPSQRPHCRQAATCAHCSRMRRGAGQRGKRVPGQPVLDDVEAAHVRVPGKPAAGLAVTLHGPFCCPRSQQAPNAAPLTSPPSSPSAPRYRSHPSRPAWLAGVRLQPSMYSNLPHWVQDGAQVLKEIEACTKAFPNSYIRLVAFDRARQVQISGFLVHRPANATEYRKPEQRSV